MHSFPYGTMKICHFHCQKWVKNHDAKLNCSRWCIAYMIWCITYIEKNERKTGENTDRQTDRGTNRQTNRQTDRQTDRDVPGSLNSSQTACYRWASYANSASLYTYITDIHTDIQKYTDRQADRQTDRQTDRHTYVHTSIHPYIHTHKYIEIQTRTDIKHISRRKGLKL